MYAGGIGDAHPATDAGVLVDDGVLDHRLGADAHGRQRVRMRLLDLLQRLVGVGAQHQNVLQPGARADARPDADHRSLDLGAQHDAPFRDQSVVDLAVRHL